MKLGALCGTVAIAALLSPVAALAQAADAGAQGSAPPAAHQTSASASKTGQSNLSEVVVTSQRRTENIQTVPIAITAIAGKDLQNKAVVREADLQYAAPGLQIVEAGYAENVNIRGIGLASDQPSVVNGVATYLNGLFQPPVLSTDTFYDIANVEVLRGPQGTLVGSNSTGGAIFINSQNPQLGHFGGYAEVAGGSYDYYSGQGAVNVPVNDILALRFAGDYVNRGSYYTNLGPAKTDAGSLDEKSGRFSALLKPADNFQALLKIQFTDRNTGGYAYKPIPDTPYAPYSVPGDFNLDYNTPTRTHEQDQQYGLELRYTLPDGIVIRSMSGYQNKYFHNLFDSDAVADDPGADLQTTDQFAKQVTETQEINLISPTTGRLNWILGGYFQHDLITVDITSENQGFPTKIYSTNDKYTYGVFGQTNYKVTQTVELQLGLRYSGYSVGQAGYVNIGPGIPGFPPGGLQVANLIGSENDGALTGKADLNWQVNQNNLLYVFASRGYKSGGVNSATSNFKPETVWDYEAGWKSTLLDGRLRTQLGAFYNSYENFQFQDIDLTSGQSGVRNFPTTSIWGFEGQFQAKLGQFGADGGFSYVHSKVGNATIVNTRALPASLGTQPLPQCAQGVPAGPTCFDYAPYQIDIDGGTNLFSPTWTFNVGAEYTFDLPGGVTLTPRLNYAYVDSSWTTFFYSPVTDLLPAHGLLSALVTLRKDRWSVEGYVTNLANKRYVSGQFGNNEFFGAPREGGVRLSATF